MKHIVFLSITLTVLLAAGAGCPPTADDKTAPAPTSQPESKSTAVTEPFDINDYLDAALEELGAVE